MERRLRSSRSVTCGSCRSAALLYVRAEWVKAANIGVDNLTAVYVSMGITPPSQNR
jgi:uncharacterized membrane protein